MSDYDDLDEELPPADAERIVAPIDDERGDPEAPADDIDPEEPMPDSERPVEPSYDDPTTPNDGLATEGANPPDVAGVDRKVEADPDELAKDDPDFQHHLQEENAETSLDQPSDNAE
ncbi:MAG TPA: hypothetical protein VFK34_13555 [Marmoricola sp.]|jgi:hypothetical protein|nr:hypothetical protein [Marmoricola sp.]